MSKNLDDILKKSVISSQKEQENERKSPRTKTIFKWLGAFVIDFVIFGIFIILLYLLRDNVLMNINGRLYVFNIATYLVVANILLISYFYFYVKDHEGSTLGMKIFKIKYKVKGIKDYILLTLRNINFWIYFIFIDVFMLNQISGVKVNTFLVALIILQIFFITYLNNSDKKKFELKKISEESKDE